MAFFSIKASSINDVTAIGGRGYQGFCDNSIKALVLKSVTMGGGVSKIIKYYVTSFMDDPYGLNVFHKLCNPFSNYATRGVCTLAVPGKNIIVL
jgi:hypothetical protein